MAFSTENGTCHSMALRMNGPWATVRAVMPWCLAVPVQSLLATLSP